MMFEVGVYTVNLYFGTFLFQGTLGLLPSSLYSACPLDLLSPLPPLSILLRRYGRLAFKDCISWTSLPPFPAGFSQREAQQEIMEGGKEEWGWGVCFPVGLWVGSSSIPSLKTTAPTMAGLTRFQELLFITFSFQARGREGTVYCQPWDVSSSLVGWPIAQQIIHL